MLTQVNDFLSSVVLSYIPQVIVAVLILLVAAVLADATKKVVVGTAKAAGSASANFFGGIAMWSIWIFAFIIALSQLGIAPDFMRIFFMGVVAMISIAGGLAFGLGGKEAAARFIERLRSDISQSQRLFTHIDMTVQLLGVVCGRFTQNSGSKQNFVRVFCFTVHIFYHSVFLLLLGILINNLVSPHHVFLAIKRNFHHASRKHTVYTNNFLSHIIKLALNFPAPVWHSPS